MTAQTYHTDDDQRVQEHDQETSENNVMEPDAGPAVAEAPLAEAPLAEAPLAEAPLTESYADPAVAEAPLADAPLAESYAGHAEHEDPTSHSADGTALAEDESAAASMSDPGFTADGDDDDAEPRTADSSRGNPLLVSAAFTVPASDTESHLAGNPASGHGPWNEIQAMFVDDPRASVESAAVLVDGRVEQLIESVRQRQRSMQSACQDVSAGTEELRVALQRYRTFWNSLEDLPVLN